MQHLFYYNSPVGLICIQATEEAITHLTFVDETNIQVDTMVNNTPAIISRCIEELEAYFKNELTAFSVKIAPKGTDFQQRVWAELIKIPYGYWTSYSKLSKDLGDLKAIRAVGTANGKNPIAIIIPCHRVIGSNGALTGYSGGLWRKKWLLNHENAQNIDAQQRLF